ncbi:MAG: diguanylate cyclase [Nostoc desertorum CM1-VF14]|jgi:diguanylate cyclase (GGDEF)-like protein|nr:diguanylate cyclase [Nostoc desertorum CM1-VF14]
MKTNLLESKSLVLIVDDESCMRMILRHSLEREGYQIAEAQNGIEAIKVFKQLHPDIVLLDALMPDMDGFECCTQLELIDHNKHTPILMITGLDDQESVDRAFEVGVMDYITKPVHWPVLRQKVKLLIQQSQLQQELKAVNVELQRLVTIDELTQLANYSHFIYYLEMQWNILAHHKDFLSLIWCDIDYFKQYNHIYNYTQGNKCLRKIGSILKDNAQKNKNLVARYGGDKFVVIMPRTNRHDAHQIAETIQTTLKGLKIEHEGSNFKYVTLSIGVTTTIPPISASSEQIHLDNFLKEAENQLYNAKKYGRNIIYCPNTNSL